MAILKRRMRISSLMKFLFSLGITIFILTITDGSPDGSMLGSLDGMEL